MFVNTALDYVLRHETNENQSDCISLSKSSSVNSINPSTHSNPSSTNSINPSSTNSNPSSTHSINPSSTHSINPSLTHSNPSSTHSINSREVFTQIHQITNSLLGMSIRKVQEKLSLLCFLSLFS